MLPVVVTASRDVGLWRDGLCRDGVAVVRVPAADLEVAVALGVGRVQLDDGAEVAANVDEAGTAVSDDLELLRALVVGHAVVSVGLVVGAVLGGGVHAALGRDVGLVDDGVLQVAGAAEDLINLISKH